MRKRITAAVSRWAKSDDQEARRMIEYACDDFNVGDLASCNLRSGPLSDCLARHGVGNLTVESVALDGWNYDTPLVELEDE